MALLSVNHVAKRFVEGSKVSTLFQDVTFEMKENEIICIVGPSGCGKSTLIRMIAGLEKPTEGHILFEGEAIDPADPKVSMVFQSFALLPWLNVLDNVAIGLEAMGLSEKARKERALKFIEKVGLDGYEEAYPREISSGMKQRAGIARALATEPELLCMDEPFSSLDPFTAENLRDEILQLWKYKEFPTNAILMVTHNIEEAVYLADKVIVMAGKPAKIVKVVDIDLKRPRDKKSKAFFKYTDDIYTLLT